jgi:hypothetical protein
MVIDLQSTMVLQTRPLVLSHFFLDSGIPYDTLVRKS